MFSLESLWIPNLGLILWGVDPQNKFLQLAPLKAIIVEIDDAMLEDATLEENLTKLDIGQQSLIAENFPLLSEILHVKNAALAIIKPLDAYFFLSGVARLTKNSSLDSRALEFGDSRYLLGETTNFLIILSQLLIEKLAKGLFIPTLQRKNLKKSNNSTKKDNLTSELTTPQKGKNIILDSSISETTSSAYSYFSQWKVLLNEDLTVSARNNFESLEYGISNSLLNILSSFPTDFSKYADESSDINLKNVSANNLNSHELSLSYIETIGNELIKLFLSRFNFVPEFSENIKHSALLDSKLSWLKNLTESEEIPFENEHELFVLEKSLRNWIAPLTQSNEQKLPKLSLEIVEPNDIMTNLNDPTIENWMINIYFLINTKGGDKFHKYTWEEVCSHFRELNIDLQEFEELNYKILQKLAEHFPALNYCLEGFFPTNINLNQFQAYELLKQSGEIAEKFELEIKLPSWWRNQKFNFGIKAQINPLEAAFNKPSILGIEQLLNCNLQLSLAEQELDFEEIKKLVDKGQPLINFGGNWVEVPLDKLKFSLQFLDKIKDKKIKLVDLLKMSLGMDDSENLLPFIGFDAQGWVSQLLRLNDQDIPSIVPPEQFCGILRDYQLAGFSWLNFMSDFNIGACLADDMGLGKTIQFLALITKEKLLDPNQAPNLLIVPTSIINNWIKEVTKFSPELRSYIHHGNNRLAGEEFKSEIKTKDLVITSYSIAFRDEELFGSIKWRRITLDEAQNIKNLNSKQSKAIKNIALMQLADSSQPTHRIALSGTPIENNLEELWSIFDFLNPGLLGNIQQFRTRYVNPIINEPESPTTQNLAQIVKPFILRRLKTDPTVIKDLPEKIEIIEEIDLTAEQALLYQNTLNQMLPQIENTVGIHRQGHVLSTITKLKQICDHPVLFLKEESKLDDRSSKLNRLVELLEIILEQKEKCLIFSQYAQMGTLLKEYLTEKFSQEVLFLHGGLDRKKRDDLVESFQTENGPSIFVLSLKAGGYGLNLTQANHVVHYDQWWNPSVEQQASDRAYRIGQTKNVQVRKLICKGTLEEKIEELLYKKINLANEVIGSSRSAITKLSNEELKAVLKLQSNLISD